MKTLILHIPLSWDRVSRSFFKSFVEMTGLGVRLDPRVQCGHLGEKEFTWMDQDLSGRTFEVTSV